MKTRHYIIGFLMTILLTSFVDDPDFPYLPKLKSITEYREWADTTKYKEKKWLKSRREYFPNGEIKLMLYVEYNRDTTLLRTYKLNKDSVISEDNWYNRFLKEWMKGDKYFYKKGIHLPYMTKDNDNYKCYYKYDSLGQVIDIRLSDDKNQDFTEYEFMYDSAGLMIQQIEYDFFNGQRDTKKIYTYDYERNSAGQITKKEKFFIPYTTENIVTKTDKQGNQKTTYYGFTAKTKTLMETIFYNNIGERIKKIEYDRDDKPQFIWTYDYEYYK